MIKSIFSNIMLSSFFLSLVFFTPSLVADETDADQQKVTELLALDETPDGVVFELIGNEKEYLLEALNKVEDYKTQLQEKFPELDIAVVSHGSEQFNLTTKNQSKAGEAHSLVKKLVAEDVPVHICETHASWRGVVPEDFPDYITVSATGPAEINNYQELGYTLIVIE